MTQLYEVELVLVGVNAGKTVKLNHLQFVNGSCIVQGDPDNMQHAINYYRSYSAFPAGSPEYEAAEERYQLALLEEFNGVSDSPKATERGAPDAVSSALQSVGPGASDTRALRRDADAGRDAGRQGHGANGDGREDSGVSSEQADHISDSDDASVAGTGLDFDTPMARAIIALDPDNEDHWTEEGLPKVSVVEQAFGTAGVTRQDVESAIPGWNREIAREAHKDADNVE